MQALWPTLVLFSECFITETTGCRCFWKFLLSHCTNLFIYMHKDPDSQNKVDLFRKNRKKGFSSQKQDSNFFRSPASPVPQTIRSIRHTVIFLRFPSASISRARRNISAFSEFRTHARTQRRSRTAKRSETRSREEGGSTGSGETLPVADPDEENNTSDLVKRSTEEWTDAYLDRSIDSIGVPSC
ncbi:hypothetical protein EUGRSUZ_H02607 [Eucalyptus grandis]|uniref:Uncharacterized protein n=2 Tax=Eucalyptus grandis TaxID=71139 RepID=A0ACC3JS85_EUCGR|nr:hypothetical protein EUGRSUZ_H02607 [Eucalyptus grandis]